MVTPYLFALNSCHLEGDWCFYPEQLSAPPPGSAHHKYCDLYSCTPHLVYDPAGIGSAQGYPTDEKSLLSAFPNKAIAKEYMSIHWENFITKDDVEFLANQAGVEYVKVSIPHYAMNEDILDDEPWVDGQWMYFVRFVGWARQHGIKVWIDLHTEFGAPTGNSLGSSPGTAVCEASGNLWVDVDRSMKAIELMAQAVMDDNLRDVVTGFGIPKETVANCPMNQVQDYYNKAFQTVRDIMGPDTAVYMSDSSNAASWNDRWWTDPNEHMGTFLDSHYYHVFSHNERALSPKQHVAYTCAKLARDVASCCFDDPSRDRKVSSGISRIVGEWSAGYDILPSEMTKKVMEAIRNPAMKKELLLDRQLTREEQDFLKNHVQAQMVAYESSNTGTSRGWFFWTLKTEGGAFAEWDFMRGIREGWIPRIPSNRTDSVSLFGSCDALVAKTIDNTNIINEFPDPRSVRTDPGAPIDDDFVVSRGKTKTSGFFKRSSTTAQDEVWNEKEAKKFGWFSFFGWCAFLYGIWTYFLKREFGFRGTGYSSY
eukprot:CAMPEP_0197192292 /NCGR_PEP_ID=MMETSP1423-20130617/24837_1 /TAXON_ID=476441 /ORGANISM="Pseudo-nitzschia heimii, Strain UNC1101" /LENGTH=537 /DNA_ID=CAMNT_0042645149 /DNA_START=208 /DNA_END=1821 /DNA_ORIENTATION=-